MQIFKIYCCGITPNKNLHIGHVRTILISIMWKQLLNFKYKKIQLAINWTDIDLKIIDLSEKISLNLIARLQIKRSFKQLSKFCNLKIIDHWPKVSHYIPLIVKNIIKMRKNINFKSGGVYLKNIKSSILNVSTEGKFCLWKKHKRGFKTILGKGIPGWHSECSTMIYDLYKQCDMHLGGRDLLFPHHVNENLVHKCAHNIPVTIKWEHIGLINFRNEKMSKSLSNSLKLNQFNVNSLRIYLTFFNYKKDINFSWSSYRNILKIFNHYDFMIDDIFKDFNKIDKNLYQTLSESLSWKNLKREEIQVFISYFSLLNLPESRNIKKILKWREISYKNKNFFWLDRQREILNLWHSDLKLIKRKTGENFKIFLV